MHARKSLDCHEQNIKHSESWEGRGRTVESFYLRTNIYNNRQNVDRNMLLKNILVRSKMEMRNMLLDNEKKIVFVIRWPGTWLNCVSLLAFCGRENLRAVKLDI